MAEDTKTSQVNLRLQPALKAAAELAAAKDHRSLTSLVEKLLADYVRTRPTLEDWHRCASERFTQIIQRKKATEQISHGYSILSYSVRTTNGETLPPHQLTNILKTTNAKLGGVFTSPNFIYPYTRQDLLPYYVSDERLERGNTAEILEFAGSPEIQEQMDFWRISPSGIVSYICPYFEDRSAFQERGLFPGKWFWPYMMTRRLAELVLHAHVLSERFTSAETIEFRCEWTGLLERELADPDPMVHWDHGDMARINHRIVTGECSARSLNENWPEIVGALGGPIMRLFDPTFDYSSDFVRSQTPRFKN